MPRVRAGVGQGGVRAGNPVFTALFSFQILEKENRALWGDPE